MKIILIISFLAVNLLHSEEDSTRVFRLNDVVVTGTRTAIAIEKLSSSVHVVDSVMIAQSNGISVADVLKNSAALSLRSYGGNASLQSVSIRGMNSDYSLILLNGQRFTTYQISTVDVGIFSLMDVERIEIASGGNSSLYGADAVGGVVNIITKKPNGKISGSVLGSVGSFGMSGYQFSVSGGDEQLSLRGSMRMEHARNDFDFSYNDGMTKQAMKRNGADYLLKNYSLSGLAVFDEHIISNFSIRYSDANRGQPSAVTSIYQNNLARIHDKDVFANALTEITLSDAINFSLPFSFHYNHQTYSDPNLVIGGSSLSSFYRNRIWNITPTVRYSFSEHHSIVLGNDITDASITSNEVKISSRNQFSGFISSLHQFTIPFEVIVFPSLRYDSFSDTKGDISPKIGINIGVLDEPKLRLRSSYGKNYRAPTFNDLYWINGGNPNLNPERSLSFDAGMIAGFQYEIINADVEANYFSIDAKNKIVWQPGAGGIWSPKNLQSVSSKGIEISARINIFNDLLMLNYHHNFLQTIKTSAEMPNDETQNKILPFAPQEFSTIVVGSSFEGISVNVIYSFTGFRFQTADNNPRFILPTFEKTDANISYRFLFSSFSLRVKGEVNNIINAEYQLISGYPTPLRSYMMTTEFLFH